MYLQVWQNINRIAKEYVQLERIRLLLLTDDKFIAVCALEFIEKLILIDIETIQNFV